MKKLKLILVSIAVASFAFLTSCGESTTPKEAVEDTVEEVKDVAEKTEEEATDAVEAVEEKLTDEAKEVEEEVEE